MTQTINISKEELETNLKQGLTYSQIAAIFNVHYDTIYRRVKHYGLSYLNVLNKNKLPDDFLQPINSKDKAYLVGYILGDGSFVKNHNNDCVILSSSLRDMGVIKFLAKIVKANTNIYNQYDKRYKKIFSSIRWKKTIPHISDILQGKNKKDRCFPAISDEWLPYLIRGLFEADGCINATNYRSNISQRVTIAHHQKCLEKLKSILLKVLSIDSYLYEKNNGTYYLLEMHKWTDVCKFSNFIYADTNFMPMKRKYDKFLQISKLKKVVQ